MPFKMTTARRWILMAILLAALPAGLTSASQTVTHPYVGVTSIARVEESPKPVRMQVILIELQAPGVRFLVSPPGSDDKIIKQTTLQFLAQHKAQIAINAHFFEPWPAPSPDPGTAKLVGLAASDGRVYSPFNDKPPKSYAIRANAPALNITAANDAAIVHRNLADPTGCTVVEDAKLYNAVAGNEQILTHGEITAGTGKWDNTPGPLTVIGLAPTHKLVMLVVDGRQPSTSEGMTTREAAEMLCRDYGVTDAINLDGGGSSTLCMADPACRVVNVPVGIDNKPGTLRALGSNLAVFAITLDAGEPAAASRAAPEMQAQAPAPVTNGSTRAWLLVAGGVAGVAVLVVSVLARRISPNRD